MYSAGHKRPGVTSLNGGYGREGRFIRRGGQQPSGVCACTLSVRMVLHREGRKGMINGEQPGSGWWRESDGGWYLQRPYLQADTLPSAPGPRHAVPGKRSHRHGRPRVRPALAVIAALASLASISASIVIFANSSSKHIRPQAPAARISGVAETFTAQDQIRTAAVTPARLEEALLPTREIGSATTVKGPDTHLSHITGSCGEPALSGVRAMAFESLRDSQTGGRLSEIITDWDNPADARRSVRLDRKAAEQAGRCRASSDGVTENVLIRRSGSAAAQCGQYLAVRASGGFRVMTQCGSVTVVIQVLAKRGLDVSQVSADDYLKDAVSRLPASWLASPRSSATRTSHPADPAVAVMLGHVPKRGR